MARAKQKHEISFHLNDLRHIYIYLRSYYFEANKWSVYDEDKDQRWSQL